MDVIRNNRLTVAVTFLFLHNVANAGFWDELKKETGFADPLVQVVTAPAETVVNTARAATGHGNVADVFRPYREIGRSAGSTVGNVADLVTNPQEAIYREIEKELDKTVGDPGVFVFDVATFQQRYLTQLANSGAHALGNTLRGQNPFQLAAAPLAGAIRAARDRHYSRSMPLPNDVKKQLASHFDVRILNRARYSIGKVEITLPNFIGGANRFMGDDYAVVVDDVIVFNTSPPAYADQPFWWAHEITHVLQYSDLGVEKFAYKYMTNYTSIEREADRKGRDCTFRRPTRTHQMGAMDKARERRIHNRPTPKTKRFQGHLVDPFIAQCVFPSDCGPFHYFVTRSMRIIAINAFNGQWRQIGWATPPMAQGIAWTYQTPRLRYAVDPIGRILTINRFGQFVQIGHIVPFV